MTHTEAVNSLATARYLLDEMTEPERDAFEAHYFDCTECAEDVTTGARMQDGVKAGLIHAPHVARVATFAPAAPKGSTGVSTSAVRGFAWYRSAALPWAVAATLAVVVGYQAQSGMLRDARNAAGGVELLSPVLLRPASRGAVPTVRLTQPHAALALDIDAMGATEVTYELVDAAGATITSGRHDAPVAGALFLLVIPAFTLAPQQRYSLTVRDAANPTRSLGEYPFITTR